MDFQKIREFLKENKILILILTVSFIIRIIFVFNKPVIWWDESVYANLGYHLSKNPFDYSLSNTQWSDFIPSSVYPYQWPNIGFRAPLLSYFLSFFYLLKLDFLILILMPLIGTASVLLTYILGKKLFNKRIGLISALFLGLLPLHIIFSSEILTDVFSSFFVLLTFFCFWKGFEENNKKYKILFGFFLALSLLARYTILWIIPIFLIYFLIRDRSLKFLRDKYLWYSIFLFFIVLIPLFIYGFIAYRNILGPFIHGFNASSYWGGVQPWYFFLEYGGVIFDILGIIFIFSLIYIIYKKKFLEKGAYLLLIWILFFLLIASLMPHKEERFILPLIPPICIFVSYFIEKISRYKKIILIVLVCILIISISWQFFYKYKKSYNGTNLCFKESNKFIDNMNKDILVISDESPILYYYNKNQIRFYPNPFSLESLQNSIIETKDEDRAYILFTDYDMPLYKEQNIKIKEILDKNFKKVFECDRDWGLTVLYKYK